MLNNPYLDAVCQIKAEDDGLWMMKILEKFPDGRHGFIHSSMGACMPFLSRDEYCHFYSWAIPSESAVRKICEYSPIVEMGAGAGYWAYMIKQAGGQIFPYDICPVTVNYSQNKYHRRDTQPEWYHVIECPEIWEPNPDQSLMLCWPPLGSLMAVNYLKKYKGDIVIYIGELEGGCCAEETFFYELDTHWSVIEEINIPQWYGMHDYCTIYRRK